VNAESGVEPDPRVFRAVEEDSATELPIARISSLAAAESLTSPASIASDWAFYENSHQAGLACLVSKCDLLQKLILAESGRSLQERGRGLQTDQDMGEIASAVWEVR
jgi:hypothetical protein